MAIKKNTVVAETKETPDAEVPVKETKKATVSAKSDVTEVTQDDQDDSDELDGDGPEVEDKGPTVNTMSRKDLAAVVRQKVFDAGKAVPITIAEIMVVGYEEAIQEALVAGAIVNLPGFGKFMAVPRPGGEKRNPATGEKIMVGPSTAVKFRVGSKLKEAVNQPKPE